MNQHPLLSEYGHFKHALAAFVEDLTNIAEPLKKKIERECIDRYQTNFLEFTGDTYEWDDFYVRPRRITFVYKDIRIHRTYYLEALFEEISDEANLRYEDKFLSHYVFRLRNDGYRLYLNEEGIILSTVKLDEHRIQSEFVPDSSSSDEEERFFDEESDSSSDSEFDYQYGNFTSDEDINPNKQQPIDLTLSEDEDPTYYEELRYRKVKKIIISDDD